MNEKNLIPLNQRTKEQQREIATKGGKASGASRRRKKSMKMCMEMLLSLPASQKSDHELLASLGAAFENIDDEDINNMMIVNAALLRKAKNGDVNAIKELRNIIQDDAYLKLQREKLRLDKQKIQKPPAAENIQVDALSDSLQRLAEELNDDK